MMVFQFLDETIFSFSSWATSNRGESVLAGSLTIIGGQGPGEQLVGNSIKIKVAPDPVTVEDLKAPSGACECYMIDAQNPVLMLLAKSSATLMVRLPPDSDTSRNVSLTHLSW